MNPQIWEEKRLKPSCQQQALPVTATAAPWGFREGPTPLPNWGASPCRPLAHLVAARAALHHGEAIVIGSRVAEDIHDSPHFLTLPQAGDRGAHHLAGGGGSSDSAQGEPLGCKRARLPPGTRRRGPRPSGRQEGASLPHWPLPVPLPYSSQTWGEPSGCQLLNLRGSERVRSDGGLPVQEGDALELDVHIIQALEWGDGNGRERP